MIGRIVDASEVWNNAGANVNLNQVFSAGAADIHVDGDSTSGCGSEDLTAIQHVYSASAIPEPSSFAVLSISAMALVNVRKRKNS